MEDEVLKYGEKFLQEKRQSMEYNVLDIDDLDQKIYRIFSIKRFIQLMRSKELVLVNPSKWDDPFENFFLQANAIDSNGQIVSLEELANSWYGQCWTYNKESDALWRIYSHQKDGIRVSTTIRKLFSSFWNEEDVFSGLKYFIGKVSYHPRCKIESFMRNISFEDIAIGGQNNGFAELLCIKRPEFSHEKEVRVLINDIGDNKIGKNGCYRQPFDYTKVFNDICLDPRLDKNCYIKIRDKFRSMGCPIPITQSELYKVSCEPIRL